MNRFRRSSWIKKRATLVWSALLGRTIVNRITLDLASDPVAYTSHALIQDAKIHWRGRPGLYEPGGHTDIYRAMGLREGEE